ncbi:hypothetical protein GCM10022402_46300 [Salinactinospora qingdaonensis]|uniref:Exonuclease domain-containing protein n=1 Tax=Salinactinospora qingdaonensis TaxID=702744 RepID=A0ABP7GH33_9ACTN
MLDVETTGLQPAEGARVCEIAVVRMRGDGTVVREFTTLVDPRVPVTGQQFHGIAGGDVIGAPTAADLVGDLTELFSGAVVVGHNLDFEERFLAAEFVPAGLPAGAVGLCTLLALRSQVELRRYSLPRACHALNGRWPTGQHTALGDARACAQMLAELIANAPGELRFLGPRPVTLPPPPRPAGQARLKSRLPTGTLAARLSRGSLRGAPAHPLRRWPSLWRPLELEPQMCTGPFTPEQRTAAVTAAKARWLRMGAVSATAALTGTVAAAVAARALVRRVLPS